MLPWQMKSANTLLKESDHARQEGAYFEYSNEMAAYDLMVIDDFGLMDLDIEKCRDLFEIIESRDCRKATIIISSSSSSTLLISLTTISFCSCANIFFCSSLTSW